MFTISMQISDEQELYNPFDPGRENLSGDVRDYILERLSEKNLGDEVQIRIISPEPVDETCADRAFRKWIEGEERKAKAERHRNLVRQVWMFAVGVVFIMLSLVLENRVGEVWYTVLSTIGAFSMWEAAAIWIVENPRLRMRRSVVRRLKENARVTYEAVSDGSRK